MGLTCVRGSGALTIQVSLINYLQISKERVVLCGPSYSNAECAWFKERITQFRELFSVNIPGAEDLGGGHYQ